MISGLHRSPSQVVAQSPRCSGLLLKASVSHGDMEALFAGDD